MNEQENTEMDSSSVLNHLNSSGLNRYCMFQILMSNAFEGVCSGVSEESYVKLFGGLTALKKSKSAPMKMNKTLKTKLLETLNSNFKQMVQDENMKEKFNILENLIDECALYEGRETWRPNGNVEDHVRSHVMDKKLKYKCALEESVREKEHSTEMLKQQVSDLRAQTRELEAALQQISDICLDSSTIDRIDKQILEKALNFK